MPSVKRNVKKRPPVYWRSTAGVYSNNRQEKNFGMENSQANHTESATQASRDRTPGLRRYLAAKSPGRNYDRLNHEPHDLVCAAPVGFGSDANHFSLWVRGFQTTNRCRET